MRIVRLVLLPLVVLWAGGCSRKVVVTTPGSRAEIVALKVTNEAAQAVTVMVQVGGTDFTIGSVPANTTAVLTVPQVAPGSTVRLRATLADGSRSFTRDGVVLTGTFEWRVP